MRDAADFIDTDSAVDEGGGVKILHDAGAIRRNVVARELAIFTNGALMENLTDVARQMDANGERPCIKFYRDDAGKIAGVTLCAEAA